MQAEWHVQKSGQAVMSEQLGPVWDLGLGGEP